MKNNALAIKNNFIRTSDNRSLLLFGKLIDADFTICIPIYGVNVFLKEALDSIESQEYNTLRVQIIVSDNKFYEYENTAIQLLQNYPLLNIAYYNTEREMCQYDNFNRCFQLCKTDYMGMLHDDDLLSRNYFSTIQKVIPWLKKHKKVAILQAKYSFFYDKKEIKEDTKSCIGLKKISNIRITHNGYSFTGIPSCGTVFNVSAVKACGGYNVDYYACADAFIGGTFALNKYKLYEFDNYTGFYRVGNNVSLKTEICKEFILEDEIFRAAWSEVSILRRAYMVFFRRYLYSKNIDGKVSTFGVLNKDITVHELDYLGKYKSYKKYSLILLIHKCIGKFINCITKLTRVKIGE